jgi:tRNA pseudouridine38-40 synthase
LGLIEDISDSREITLRIEVAYVGSAFHGWQIQSNLRSVQGDLQRQVSRLLGRETALTGAGRTDAGVNARGQVAHIKVANDDEARRVIGALPKLVPADISLGDICVVSPRFNARFSAIARRYSYHISFNKDIFRPHEWQMHTPIGDRDAMDAAAGHFIGSHDFSSFCKTSSLKAAGNLCHMELCAFDWQDESVIFHVKANRFLHHMVRIMVGTLVEVGEGTRSADSIPSVLEACERSEAGRMAPPEGLFLEEVYYPEHVLDPLWTGENMPEES